MTPHRTVSASLEHRTRTAGGAPLLTHYGPATERTELSVASFANWVAKTVNLLDDLGLDADATVTLPVLAGRPAHWMALVWPFALWQAGLPAHLDAPDADLAVLGPDAPAPAAPTTLACSLDAWGRGLADLPGGVLDYSTEALAQSDFAQSTPADKDAPAWVEPGHDLSVGDLAALDPITDRVLAQPTSAHEAVLLLARAILGGGSVVFVESAGDPARTATAEKARVLR
ncbi:MAG: TIGR03089 family protein [Propionibacteriaceae bacterium]|nr:TIGR03089 family protein [Propionibacteriaceae bacterium]